MLDAYVKDVIGSFFLFVVSIGPIIYLTYIKKPEDQIREQLLDDKYARLLKTIK